MENIPLPIPGRRCCLNSDPDKENYMHHSQVNMDDRRLSPMLYHPTHHKNVLSNASKIFQKPKYNSPINSSYSGSRVQNVNSSGFFHKTTAINSSCAQSSAFKPKQKIGQSMIAGSYDNKHSKVSTFSNQTLKTNRIDAKKSLITDHVPSFIKKAKKQQQQVNKQTRNIRNSGRKGSLVKSATYVEADQIEQSRPTTTSILKQLVTCVSKESLLSEARDRSNSDDEDDLVLSGIDCISSYNINTPNYNISTPNLDNIPSLSADQKSLSMQALTHQAVQESNRISQSQLNKFPKLQDFQLGQMLGKGAYGSVRVARHKETGYFLALKNYPLKSVKQRLDRFVECIRLQMALNHPNIASLYGFFIQGNDVYLMMELCVDIDLSSQIKSLRKRAKQMQDVIKGIVRGLQHMHDNQVLHRDIKLQNVLMCYDMPKITDFDLAVYLKTPAECRRTFCGSPAYFSPQMISNYEYNNKADVWSLGILCYELICGYFPFDMKNYNTTVDSIVNQDPKQYPEDVSVSAKGFVEMMLVKNPDARANWRQLLNSPFLTQ